MSDSSRPKRKNDPLTNAIGVVSICAAVMAGVCFAIHGYSVSTTSQSVAAEAQAAQGANGAMSAAAQSAGDTSASASSPGNASVGAPSSGSASASATSPSSGAATSKGSASKAASADAANPSEQVTTTTPVQNGQSANTSQSSGGKSSKKRSASNGGGATSTSSSNTTASATSSEPAPAKVWVEPVYKTVHHPEEGHYDTVVTKVKKVRCNCGEIFDTREEWKAHQDAFLAEMRKTDPDYVCTGTHLSTYITVEESEQVYVVDRAAYDEEVLVKEGYWK